MTAIFPSHSGHIISNQTTAPLIRIFRMLLSKTDTYTNPAKINLHTEKRGDT